MANIYLQQDDKTLWDELRKGNVQALEALYRRYYALLLNYGMKCTPDDEMVRDSIQDLFVRLAKSERLSDTESPRSYLLKALRNMINDKSTSATYRSEVFYFNDETFFEVAGGDIIEEQFRLGDEESDKRKALMKALSQLTPQQKHILYLRYVKELSHKEVAEVMDMNVQSSMNLLSRSISKLRTILEVHSLSLCVFLKFMQSLDW